MTFRGAMVVISPTVETVVMLLKVQVINFRVAGCAYYGPYSTVEAVVMAIKGMLL